MITMRLTRDVHCRLPEAVQALRLFAVLYGELRSAASGRSAVEFICEPLFDGYNDDAIRCREILFARWACPPPFQLPALCGVVCAKPNGLTTTISFDAVYEPDAGIVGAIFDRFLGRRLAKEGAAAFFQRLSRFVEHEVGLDNLLERLFAGGKPTGRA